MTQALIGGKRKTQGLKKSFDFSFTIEFISGCGNIATLKEICVADIQPQHFALDMENFSKDFVKIHQGIPYITVLMRNFVKMYPSFRQTPDFIRFTDEPNIVAMAMMLTPESPSEIFFVAIREKDEKGERQDIYFLTKYFNEITQFIMKSPEQEVSEDNKSQ